MAQNFENLRAHILPLSEAGEFEGARLEWNLFHVELVDHSDHCPCGHPIKELCYIRNSINGHETYVGNICVNRFIGIDTGNLFPGLRRILDDERANANADLVLHAYRLGYIYENEFDFLMETRHKRLLSAKQLEWKRKINRRIISQTVVRRG